MCFYDNATLVNVKHWHRSTEDTLLFILTALWNLSEPVGGGGGAICRI